MPAPDASPGEPFWPDWLVDGSQVFGAFAAAFAGIFAALAEYERNLINERATAAREAAQARGKHTGRPRALTPAQLRQARQLREAGESMADIVATLGVARSTYRALSESQQNASTECSP